jgi:hypothetical protein
MLSISIDEASNVSLSVIVLLHPETDKASVRGVKAPQPTQPTALFMQLRLDQVLQSSREAARKDPTNSKRFATDSGRAYVHTDPAVSVSFA